MNEASIIKAPSRIKPVELFYKCVHFKIQELVDKETFQALGESAWMLFDRNLLGAMDRIRERYDVEITVNNWATGGPFSQRGFRSSDSTTGAKLSGHRRGQNLDFDVKGKTADWVRKDILDNKDHIDFMLITRMEVGISWVHIGVENVPGRILLFNPA